MPLTELIMQEPGVKYFEIPNTSTFNLLAKKPLQRLIIRFVPAIPSGKGSEVMITTLRIIKS
jgi:hypothetical protein